MAPVSRTPRVSRTASILKPAALGGLALVAALALSSCSSTASGDAGGGEGSLSVVATTTQLADFTSEVGGDDVEVTGLLQPGSSAHHFDPTPADLLALGEADVLVVNGAGLETFVDSAIEASGFDGEIITAAHGLDETVLREITAEGGAVADDHDHAHEGEVAHAEDGGAPDEHGADEHGHEADEHGEEAHDHGDHDHGDVNPHIWTSPRNAEGMVEEIAKGLAKADPADAEDYAQRAEEYVQKLGDLDAWITAQFERVPAEERVLVSGHDSLRYYLHDYGIEFAGSILPSFEDNAEPSAAEIDALVASIRERGVKAVFVESSMSPKLAQTIAKEAGVQVVDAESLFADSLGAKGTDGETYIGATEHNTRVILEAWGVEPQPLPDSLQG
ncbi:metal ABC transporter substrate-binding protein [Leucobacter ruminantium]|uniref:Zinc ABC transporter substrate-binding protein n=1 Tax=Leucobacter ruminantium TaxID=1289170 RepID=A0A939LWW4_9MICO|nr:metal ABC transporter substrate-binding protein [Leucobacter ruminantium]MBO1804418.1 zinc ABC transporter substrate-binding protein [Leucobacter ruminantium]